MFARLIPLLLFVTPLAAQQIEGTVDVDSHRSFYLDDGECYEAKLDTHWSEDLTAATWRPGDQIEVGRGEDPTYSYVLTNVTRKKTIFCRLSN